MNTSDKDAPVVWVDSIRVIASFFVVMLHSAAPLLYKYNSIPAADWWAGNIYDSVVRVCVPLFFMISGYLLLGKQESIKDFFVKRARKIVVPFVAWSVFYYFWAYYLDHTGTISLSGFSRLLLSPSYYHLWFFYAIIGLYLYIPILRIVVRYASREILYYFLLLWFVVVAIIPLMEMVTHVSSTFDFGASSGYVGYLILGYLLGNVQVNGRHFAWSLGVAVACIVVTAVGTFYLTIRNGGELNGYLYGYLSPNVIFFAAATLVLLRYLSEKMIIPSRHKRLITALSSASLGVYLVHPAALYIVNVGWLGIPLSAFSMNAIFSVPLTATCAFGLSLVIVLFLRKIPIVRSWMI